MTARRTFRVFLLAALLLLTAAQVTLAQDEPIRIGVAVAQTSNVALFGQEQVIGAQIAQEFFNERGGVNGRPIELVFQDTAGDEAGAINAFQTLIASDVVGIVGPTLSQQAFAADPLAEEAGVPVIAPSNTAQGIPQIGDFIARVSAPVALVAPSAVRKALELDPAIENVAVFYAQNDAFASSETQTFQNTVTELGLNLLPVQTFQTTDTDFSVQITNALAGNPQLVIISGLAADGGNLVRQLREFGYQGLIVGGNGLNTANIFPVCQAFCDGIIVAQAYSPQLDSEINNAFRAVYEEQQGKPPPQFSAQAFAAVQVFVEALITLDNEVGLDTLELPELRARLNETLLGLTYDTPLGPISFTEEGEVVQGQYYVAQIQMNEDGQTGTYVFLESVAAEPEPVELSGEPVHIGVAVAQTSNVALFGQEQVIGAQIAQEFFNERGGVNGRPIELVFQDTAGDEAGAINAFQTLIASDVVGIVGPTLSQQAFAADPLAEEAGVPVIAPSNTAQGIPQIGDFIARVSAPVALVAPDAVRAALELDPAIENVAVFYAQNDAFASSETQTFQNTVTELGLNLLPVQTFQTTDTDFSVQITNALAGNPQLVIISGLAADSGNLVRQLREFGYQGLIVGGNGLNTANIFPVCQAFCDGIIIAQAYSPSLESEINTEFRAMYEEQQGKPPPQFSAQAFAAVQVFVEALIALDNEVGLDTLELPELRARLNETLLGLTYDTPLGPISFTEEGEIVQEQYYVAQIQMNEDGQTGSFVFIR